MEAHNKYIQFLVDVGLLSRLTCVSHHGEVVPTNKVLCEHGEILEAAKTLKKMQNRCGGAILFVVVQLIVQCPAGLLVQCCLPCVVCVDVCPAGLLQSCCVVCVDAVLSALQGC